MSGTYSPVSVTLTVTGTNALNSIVSVTESTLPAGITASVPNLQFIVQPSITTPTQTVTFDVTGSVAPGSYPITFTASAVDGPIHTATITLVVPAFSPSPNFTFTVTPGAISIPYGTGPGNPLGTPGVQTSPGSVPLTISVIGQNGFSDCVTVVANETTGGPDVLALQGESEGLAVLPGIPQAIYVGGTYSTELTGYTQSQPGTYTATFTAYDVAAPVGCGATPPASILPPGTLTHTATVSITVGPATTAPDFTLTATPTVTVCEDGGCPTAALTVASAPLGGYVGAVNLSMYLPNGVTVSNSACNSVNYCQLPALTLGETVSGSGPSVTVQVNATAAAVPGTYPVTVTGTNGPLGPIIQSAAFQLVIEPNSSSTTPVAFVYVTSYPSGDGSVYAYTAASNGQLTQIGTYPAELLSLVPSGKYLYGRNFWDGTIQSFTIAADGGLSDEETRSTTLGEGLFSDNTGAVLYSQLVKNGHPLIGADKIENNGALEFLGNAQFPHPFSGSLTFTGNNHFMYTGVCNEGSGTVCGLGGFVRASNGMLSRIRHQPAFSRGNHEPGQPTNACQC